MLSLLSTLERDLTEAALCTQNQNLNGQCHIIVCPSAKLCWHDEQFQQTIKRCLPGCAGRSVPAVITCIIYLPPGCCYAKVYLWMHPGFSGQKCIYHAPSYVCVSTAWWLDEGLTKGAVDTVQITDGLAHLPPLSMNSAVFVFIHKSSFALNILEMGMDGP